MPSTQEFRRRIKSVNNTKQITKAMEMIASIKMQKAVKTAAATRAYTQNAWNILQKLSNKILSNDHPLITPRTADKTAVILVTSDRGLCGSYNSEVIKRLTAFLNEPSIGNGNDASIVKSQAVTAENRKPKTETGIVTDKRGSNIDVISIGKIGARAIHRYKNANLAAEFTGFEDKIDFETIVPVSKLTIDEYLAGNYDRVVIIYSHFVSSLKQIPVVKQLLPIIEEHIDHPELWEGSSATPASTSVIPAQAGILDPRVKPEDDNQDYRFEPDPDKLFDGVLKQILRAQIYGAVLEANASEHSARMVAMKSATDNAGELIDELQLLYNSIRQSNITREIAEISGAAEAMK